MKYFADLHIHSRFSRATSPELTLEHIAYWARLKGLQVVSTGDFVHPEWLDELRLKLEPAEEGLYRLKAEYDRALFNQLPTACRGEMRFILSCEIANIYKRLDKVRKVHNVLFAPDFAAAERIQKRLETIGNIRSDGRPILGLDSRDLLEITLESDPLSFLVPAHIWTPWFSALGSKGGFDRMEDCFADLTRHIFAVETGLSSDPAMNWRLSQLDPFVMISNSDAHSPQKLGRESNVLETEFSYPGIRRALADPADKGLIGTVEFFPEEGKYHYDGHRSCGTRMTPRETRDNSGLCPRCGKPVTVGVMARVEELADHEDGRRSPRARDFHRLIPLAEIIADARGTGASTAGGQKTYLDLLRKLGPEMFIIMDAPIENIRKAGGALIAEGIRRVRSGDVLIAAGYDGEYGEIAIFSSQERELAEQQMTLFT